MAKMMDGITLVEKKIMQQIREGKIKVAQNVFVHTACQPLNISLTCPHENCIDWLWKNG
jgi:hypothetical protein